MTSFKFLSLWVTFSCVLGQGQVQGKNQTLGQGQGEDASGSIIHIATLLPVNYKRFPFASQIILPALELAVNNVTASTGPLPGRDIHVHFQDSECSSAAAMNQMYNFYIQKKVHVFFGPCCDYAAAPVSRQLHYWKLPMLTAGAFARDFALGKSHFFDLVTRVGASVNSLLDFLLEIMREFQWKRIKQVYNPYDQAFVGEKVCHIMADGIHYGLQDQIIIPNLEQDYEKFEVVEHFLERMPEEIGDWAVVVLCASPDSVREIMIKAHELNFDNGEYVFFNIDLFTSKNTSSKPWYREHDTKERNEKAKKAYEALMTVTLRKPTSPEYKTFSKTVKKKAEEMYSNENFTYGEEEVNSFVGAFHDAVILYALALNESLEAGVPITNGSEITRRMWNRTFAGITGTVSIDANGDRNADYSLLDLDPGSESFHVVANYYGNKKQYEPVEGRSIAWAGGRSEAPTDTPECGFDGSKCPPEEPFPEYGIVIIVLGTIIFIVLIAAFFIYRHVKLEAELAEMNWRVRWDDILFGSPSKKTRIEESRRISMDGEMSNCSGDTIACLNDATARQLFTKTGYYKI